MKVKAAGGLNPRLVFVKPPSLEVVDRHSDDTLIIMVMMLFIMMLLIMISLIVMLLIIMMLMIIMLFMAA